MGKLSKDERLAFGDRLFAIRERFELRQVDFCQRFGLALGTFKAMETGRRDPLPIMRLLVRAIELDPALMTRVADLERRLAIEVAGDGRE